MRKLLTLLLLLSVIILSSFTPISDEEMISQGVTYDQLENLKTDYFKGQSGVIQFSSCHASIHIPTGFVFLNYNQTKKLIIDYWNNPSNRMDGILGAIVPSSSTAFYQIPIAYILSYDECGYIKDDDANNVDYEQLLEQMKADANKENKSLPKEQQLIIKGWAVPPKYIHASHVLIWAKEMTNGDMTNDVINYDMRVLGRKGMISINAVASPQDLQEVVKRQDSFIKALKFDNGYAYKDFNADEDNVSDWTIGGLIAGTAAVAAKSGLLAKLGLLLAKFWKLIVIGVVAIGTGIVKLFKGRGADEDE